MTEMEQRPTKGEESVASGMTARRQLLATLARASRAELEAVLVQWPDVHPIEALRGPENGLVMVRGRIGGAGGAFNLGEVTASRATVRIASGVVGFGYALGRDGRKVRAMAVLDALWQQDATRSSVERVAASIAVRLEGDDAQVRAEAAATKVDFFTMVRGED